MREKRLRKRAEKRGAAFGRNLTAGCVYEISEVLERLMPGIGR